MDNNLFKHFKAAMDTIEKDSINKVYLLNHDVNLKAQLLHSALCSSGTDARIEYFPAYHQIVVIADTYVLDIHTNELKQTLLNADVIGIDSASDGKLHIECVFNKAFREAGVINE